MSTMPPWDFEYGLPPTLAGILMNKPSRDLPKIGLRFFILNSAQWNADVFTGICLANGCDWKFARRIARDLGAVGSRLTTVRPLKDFETLVAACKMIGVRVEEIPPL